MPKRKATDPVAQGKEIQWTNKLNAKLVYLTLLRFGWRGAIGLRPGCQTSRTQAPKGCWTLISRILDVQSADAVRKHFNELRRKSNLVTNVVQSNCFWRYLISLPPFGTSNEIILRRQAVDAMVLSYLGPNDLRETIFDALVELLPAAYPDDKDRLRYAQSPIEISYQHDGWLPEHIKRDVDDLHAVTRGSGMKVHDNDDYWDTIARNWETHLSFIFGRRIVVARFRRQGPNTPTQFPVTDRPVDKAGADTPQIEEPPEIDVDQLMSEEKAEACFIHSSIQVEFATMAPSLCRVLRARVADEMGFRTDPTSRIIDGVRQTEEEDTAQKKVNQGDESMSTASYGAGKMQQRYNADQASRRFFGSRKVIVSFNSEETNKPLRSFSDVCAATYHKQCVPVYGQKSWKWVDDKDNFYASRPATKDYEKAGPRVWRLSHQTSRTKRERFPLPYPTKSSAPLATKRSGMTSTQQTCVVLAAAYESATRRLSEKLLSMVFGPLPMSMAPAIAYRNVMGVCFREKVRDAGFLAVRPFPKGSCGLQLEKPLHDDGNGAMSPGIWTGLTEDARHPVMFRFLTTTLRWQMSADKGRFAWFLGWMPHKTVSIANGNDFASNSPVQRLHHTAYTHLDYEHMGAAMMDAKTQPKMDISEPES